jgi:YD repeat-containing protein
MWHIEADYEGRAQEHRLAIKRTYNSKYPVPVNLSPSLGFGQGWSNAYGNYLIEVPLLPSFKDSACYRRSDNGQFVCDERVVLTSASVQSVAIARGDGKRFIFQKNSAGKWLSSADVTYQLNAVYGPDDTTVTNWTFTTGDGALTERYNARGLLTSATYNTGGTHRYTYSMGQTNDTSLERSPVDAPACNTLDSGPLLRANLLLCVTDNWGRQLNFKYDSAARITEVIDPAGQSTHYAYDGPSGGCLPQAPGSAACTANNLTKVTYADGASRTYFYNEADRINGGVACAKPNVAPGFGSLLQSMTGRIDENGDRHISWTYDCAGNATSSALAGGIEKVVLAYTNFADGHLESTVTHTVGDPANPQTTVGQFLPINVLGMTKNKSISTPCRECGTYTEKSFDANGNMILGRDFNGGYTTFKYDLVRNLQTQKVLSPYDSSLALTTSTQWHDTLRLPAKVAEPLRITDYSYDAAGRLLKRIEQATTDARGSAAFVATPSGLPRAWGYTYNTAGQVLTVTGPRTDVVDRTAYDYDAASGNLATVTNAVGHATHFADYKPDGKVGKIVAPNGTTTTYTYTVRGLVEATSVYDGETTETTAYEYDGVGQLKKVTMPDGAFVSYGYDAAHRLTSIGDTLGNTITYTLDLSGNRLKEQTTDPTGSLERKISRVFNTLDQMTQQTGGAQ